MGGLAVAARLARLRHQVTVCEQADHVGGKLAAHSQGGFTWDTGPSLLTLPAVYRDLFLKTGKNQPLEEVLNLKPLDSLARYRFPDGTWFDMPNTGVHAVSRALDDVLGSGAGTDWGRLYDRSADIWETVRGPFLTAAPTVRDLLRMSRSFRDVRTVAPWQTLRGLGRQYLRDPRLRLLLDRYATYSGSDPRMTPAALAVVPYVEQTFGGWYVQGGLHKLATAIHERAVLRGAEVRTSCDVAAVTLTGGRVNGVRLTTGEHLPADIVVANADATHLYGELLPQPRQLRRIRRTTPSLSGFRILLGLRGRTPTLQHHTVLFPDDYDAEFDAIFGRSPVPVPDPTIYVCAPDDAALRPDDEHEAWSLLVNAPRHGSVDWDTPGLAERYADHVLEILARRGGPDFDVRDRIVHRVVLTPADLERDTRSCGGSIYGTSSNGRRAAFLRPANRSPIPGLFLVGGSAHPGGGLPLVGMSAAIVADMIGRA
jgi:phytoene desaturase